VVADDIRAILLDIEGTTTPIAFVHDVLFPYARAHLREYLGDIPDPQAIALLKQDWPRDAAATPRLPRPDDSIESLARYVEWLMDRDRKSPGLKALQGLVWQRGYRQGGLKGVVFPDVPRALQRWRKAGIKTAIYSSGSVLAQRLLFGTTAFGDLTPLLTEFFDTASGGKTFEDSYRGIAAALECLPSQMLFVSDIAAEIDAARRARCQVLLCVRPGNAPQQVSEDQSFVHSFDEIEGVS
jgi:enolase-phosphatase E1